MTRKIKKKFFCFSITIIIIIIFLIMGYGDNGDDGIVEDFHL